MREGEVMYFKTKDASVVYMNPFGNPVTGYFYITDYKVYFKGNEPEHSTNIQVCFMLSVYLLMFIYEVNNSRSLWGVSTT